MVLSIMTNLLLAAGILLGGYSIYFLIIALWGLRSAPKAPVASPKTQFALVVAARNEAAVIGHLV
ncbi:MAG: glycosyl transferase, partial [Ruthenibacterium sp.]